MPKRIKSYTSLEQDWLEETFKEYRDYIDSYKPFKENIIDRTDVQPNAKGVPIIKVLATKEQTLKALLDILKEMPSLIKALEEMREKRAISSLETRGDVKVPGAMKKFVEERT